MKFGSHLNHHIQIPHHHISNGNIIIRIYDTCSTTNSKVSNFHTLIASYQCTQ